MYLSDNKILIEKYGNEVKIYLDNEVKWTGRLKDISKIQDILEYLGFEVDCIYRSNYKDF